MLSPAAASRVEIWPTMLGTLLLAIASRWVPSERARAASGKFTEFDDGALGEEVPQLVGGHPGAVVLGLVGGGAEVRQGHHVVVPVERGGGEVADVGAQLTALQRLDHGRLVDDRAAGEVHDHRRLLQLGELLGPDQATGAVHQRDVQGDDVGALQQLVEIGDVLDEGAQLPGVLDGDPRVVAQHPHAQGRGGVGHLDADRTQADDAERAPGQLEADEVLLAGLDGLVHAGRVTVEPVGEGRRRNDVAGGEEQRGHDEFLHRVGVGAGGVEHRDAAGACSRRSGCCWCRHRRGRRRAPSRDRRRRAGSRSAAAARPGRRGRSRRRSSSFGSRESPVWLIALRVWILKVIALLTRCGVRSPP